jgi:L-lysine 6-transaminase
VFKVGSRINSTYGGNLTDMVRCQRYLEIIDEDKLIENAKNVGEFILSNLRDLSAKYPRLSNVRGRGLMIAFDLPDNTLRDAFKQEMKEQGALVIPCGPQSIRLRPVLDFSQADASTALSMIETTMKKLA